MPHERRNKIVRLPSLSTLRHSPERGIGDEDVGQQARMRDAALNRQARHRRLREVIAAGADCLAPDRANHLEHCRDTGELLGHVLAE